MSCLTSPLFGPNHDFAIAKVSRKPSGSLFHWKPADSHLSFASQATVSARVLSVATLTSDIKLGVFGYCYNILNGVDQCSATQLGYELPPIIQEIASITGTIDQSTQDTIRSVTKAFVLHPIATGFAFLGFLIAACSDRIGFLCASLFTLFTFILTAACVVLDIVFFYVVRRYVEDNCEHLQNDLTYISQL